MEVDCDHGRQLESLIQKEMDYAVKDTSFRQSVGSKDGGRCQQELLDYLFELGGRCGALPKSHSAKGTISKPSICSTETSTMRGIPLI